MTDAEFLSNIALLILVCVISVAVIVWRTRP